MCVRVCIGVMEVSSSTSRYARNGAFAIFVRMPLQVKRKFLFVVVSTKMPQVL